MDYVAKITPFFTDHRGHLSHLIPDDVAIRGILLLTSKKGAVRANHYHKTDSHFSYLYSGKMQYFWKDLKKKNSRRKSVIVKAGEMVYTPPKMAHAMKFLEDSVFFAFATKPRDQKDYESDTIKISLI